MHIHLSSVNSTNTVARELLKDQPFVIVSADHQTAGRGRGGKTWEGDSGANVYISFAHRVSSVVETTYVVASMAYPTLAVSTAIRSLAPEMLVRIKYPNDVQVRVEQGWSKIAGILTEHEFEGSRCVATIIGIGINVRQTVFPETISQPCTSLLLHNVDVSAEKVRCRIIDEMFVYSQMAPFDAVAAWNKELRLIGKSIQVIGSADVWIVEQLLDDGRLLIRNSTTLLERIIDNGDSIRYID
jgi:BirA family biotin operon repressor/biotin-[acetyl-CoA-carboxylase] ligase